MILPRITPEYTIEKTYRDFLTYLRASRFYGEIRTDYAARLAVATDNSIYQVIPQAVILPKSTEDIVLAMKLSQQPPFHSIQFAPRGGGTATNGQSLSAGIIIDCSKYLRTILEMNLHKAWVRVQPGVVLDQLNQYLLPHGMHFAPEISPSNRATIGGMINTDACGIGSKIIGRTSDHIIDLTCVLSNGSIIHSGEFYPHDPLQEKLTTLLIKNQTLIRKKFFAAPRTLNGYNLAKAYKDKLNLNYLFAGSEGTLGIVTECKLKLSCLPKFKKLVVIKYHRFADALRAKDITENIQPLVIETIDEKLIALAREDSNYFKIKEFIEPAKAINLVEFAGNDEAKLNQQMVQLCHNIDANEQTLGYYLAKNETEIKLLWELRKKAVGFISKNQDGTRRPIPFIEDTAVPPEKLAPYIDDFKTLLNQHQLTYGMYGHIDAGCVHVRPALDMRISADETLMRHLSDEVVALVKKYGGVMWGEHGKGYRSEYGVEFFGEELYVVLRQIKTLFDPYNQLNPGKIAVPLDSKDNIVRIDESMRGHFDKQIAVTANNEYASALACNGNGACFNFATQDVMCPSFKVTQDRIHSPKGRATVIREWLRQLAKTHYVIDPIPLTRSLAKLFRSKKTADFSHEVFAAMAGCLACKACSNQCPLNVDIPDIKAKFLAHYYTRYRRKLRDYVIAHTETIAQWQAAFPRALNWLTQNRLMRFLLQTFLKITNPPRIDPWLNEKHYSLHEIKSNSIILIQDAFTSFYDKKVMESCCRLFKTLGFSIHVAPFFKNGKPLHVNGFLKDFEQIVRQNSIYLKKLTELKVPLIGIDPSITLTYRDEYQKMIGQENFGFNVQLPQEFLHAHLDKLPKQDPQKPYYLLSHCTEKTSLLVTDTLWQTIFAAVGLQLIPLTAGCCGMAGSYGHETEHVNHSEHLFKMGWQNHLTRYPGRVLATGYSCRTQTKRFAGIALAHPLEVLSKKERP
ncbi:MAG: hypothetical protein ACD_45C00608G0003 [uncultured bacterium]|nr:MAG: hypothetical protein ACD_45C00608G0003 [uncultured bacterium]